MKHSKFFFPALALCALLTACDGLYDSALSPSTSQQPDTRSVVVKPAAQGAVIFWADYTEKFYKIDVTVTNLKTAAQERRSIVAGWPGKEGPDCGEHLTSALFSLDAGIYSFYAQIAGPRPQSVRGESFVVLPGGCDKILINANGQ
jgi:hypothetical protein